MTDFQPFDYHHKHIHFDQTTENENDGRILRSVSITSSLFTFDVKTGDKKEDLDYIFKKFVDVFELFNKFDVKRGDNSYG